MRICFYFVDSAFFMERNEEKYCKKQVGCNIKGVLLLLSLFCYLLWVSLICLCNVYHTSRFTLHGNNSSSNRCLSHVSMENTHVIERKLCRVNDNVVVLLLHTPKYLCRRTVLHRITSIFSQCQCVLQRVNCTKCRVGSYECLCSRSLFVLRGRRL